MTENLYHKQGFIDEDCVVEELTAERVIHMFVFALLLVGFWSISAWGSLTCLSGNWTLAIAGVMLGWGKSLLVLYVIFKKLDWNWSSPV